MKSIVEERLISFKSLEQKVFAYVCELGREITRIMLENYDAELAEERDKSQYRDKGRRTTTIKTVYGEVVYARRVYQTKLEDGEKAFVYLLDEAMQMEAGQAEGKAEIPVLFEEMDGVWLSMQDSTHKKMKKQEMKVFTMYEGWDAESRGKRLVNKTMLAGMEKSSEFHRKREALIEKKYNADEIQQRILNGDGGSWIKEPYDTETIFQLDRFHIYHEIKRKLKEKEAQETVTELFEAKKMDEMLEYILIYADSVCSNDESDKRSSNAKKLYEYLANNKEGLLPYQERGIKIPEAKPGIIYKNMGVQENENCTAITLRMKHRRMRWSVNGADNMAKALYRKENGELTETIERYTDGLIFTMKMQEVLQSLSAAKAPKKDGKGNIYADIIRHHMPLLDAMKTASRKAFMSAFCS